MTLDKNLAQPEQKDLLSASTSTVIQNVGGMPNLHEMHPGPLNLSCDYWTPTSAGESKRCLLIGFENSQYLDQKTSESVSLRCVLLVEQSADMSLKSWKNGSCKLTSTVENAVNNGRIVLCSTPLEIRYLGKRKTQNGRFLDDFDIRILKSEAGDDL